MVSEFPMTSLKKGGFLSLLFVGKQSSLVEADALLVSRLDHVLDAIVGNDVD